MDATSATRLAGQGLPPIDAALARCTAREVMVTDPKSLPVTATVDDVRAAFENDHVHLVLLTHDGVLHTALQRCDLASRPPGTAPARGFGTLAGRTAGPDETVGAVHRRLIEAGERRLAVVADDGELLGLLCLKRRRTGFCTDDGIAARAREGRPAR